MRRQTFQCHYQTVWEDVGFWGMGPGAALFQVPAELSASSCSKCRCTVTGMVPTSSSDSSTPVWDAVPIPKICHTTVLDIFQWLLGFQQFCQYHRSLWSLACGELQLQPHLCWCRPHSNPNKNFRVKHSASVATMMQVPVTVIFLA